MEVVEIHGRLLICPFNQSGEIKPVQVRPLNETSFEKAFQSTGGWHKTKKIQAKMKIKMGELTSSMKISFKPSLSPGLLLHPTHWPRSIPREGHLMSFTARWGDSLSQPNSPAWSALGHKINPKHPKEWEPTGKAGTEPFASVWQITEIQPLKFSAGNFFLSRVSNLLI